MRRRWSYGDRASSLSGCGHAVQQALLPRQTNDRGRHRGVEHLREDGEDIDPHRTSSSGGPWRRPTRMVRSFSSISSTTSSIAGMSTSPNPPSAIQTSFAPVMIVSRYNTPGLRAPYRTPRTRHGHRHPCSPIRRGDPPRGRGCCSRQEGTLGQPWSRPETTSGYLGPGRVCKIRDELTCPGGGTNHTRRPSRRRREASVRGRRRRPLR